MKNQPLTPPHTLTAWQEELTEAARNPKLNVQLAEQGSALYPRFAANYQHLTSLPRRVRRTLQRKWKRSLAGVALLMALGQGPALAGTTIPVAAGDEAALIQAIIDANSELPPFDGPDTLILSNSTFTLTEVNNGTYGPTGLPVIESDITIEGNGSTIERSTATGTPEFRLLAVGYDGHLTLEQTIITGGDVPQPPLDFPYNGAYADGGGVANYGGTVALIDSTVSENRGGGVFNSDGTMTLAHSTISDNRSSLGSAGGIGNNSGTVTLAHSTVSGNFSSYASGGIHNGGTMTITNSAITRNASEYAGGITNTGTMTLTNSTVSHNGAFKNVGGIANNGGTLTLTNSTVSNNVAGVDGSLALGGVYNRNDGVVTFSHTLVSGNRASGGVEVANRSGTINADDHNLFGHSGLTNAEAFNGFTPGPTDITATSDGTMPTDLSAILQVDPTTGNPLLQDNGGLTKTLALVDGSPAIDAVPGTSCPPPETDQRGYPRPVDGNDSSTAKCDIGAYEFGVERLNEKLTFAPIPGTFSTTTGAGVEGCPVTFEGGAFSFEAQLTNKSGSPSFTHLGVQVITLSNSNELLLDAATQTTGGVGAALPVPADGGYIDEILEPNEQVNVPFTICLEDLQSFGLFVDVFGQKTDGLRSY